MTHIVVPYIKTKKTLKEMLTTGQHVFFDDPSIVNPWPVDSEEMQPGDTVICTNHPKRSWYAQVTKTQSGWRIS